jgi:adenine C2-methylase RlmN of 23S rRNA A2503 and tRNA A37
VEFQLEFRTYLKEEWNEVDYENYTKEEWNKFVDSLSNNEVINIAGYNCYSTIKKAFKQVGFDNLLVCVGDHEIGGT